MWDLILFAVVSIRQRIRQHDREVTFHERQNLRVSSQTLGLSCTALAMLYIVWLTSEFKVTRFNEDQSCVPSWKRWAEGGGEPGSRPPFGPWT